MKRPLQIVIEADDGHHQCGPCEHFGQAKHGTCCGLFDEYIDDYEGAKRLPECIEAERLAAEHAAMPRDVLGTIKIALDRWDHDAMTCAEYDAVDKALAWLAANSEGK